jgi:hypothetical protein
MGRREVRRIPFELSSVVRTVALQIQEGKSPARDSCPSRKASIHPTVAAWFATRTFRCAHAGAGSADVAGASRRAATCVGRGARPAPARPWRPFSRRSISWSRRAGGRPAARRDAGGLRLAAEGAVERHSAQSRGAAQGHSRELAALGPARCGDPHGCAPATRRRPSAPHAAQAPHIVVTTPESLYILLGSESGRTMLSTCRTVIVDEIHAVAGNKRGAHLALSLERLQALTAASAARGPVRDAEADRGSGALLTAAGDARRLHHRRQRPRARARPGARSAADAARAVMSGEVWTQVYDRLAELVESIAPRWCSSTRGAWPSAWRATCPSASAARSTSPRITAAWPRSGARRRAAAEARRVEGAGGHRVAGAGHRHRRCRSGLPDRLAALDRLPAARRPRRPCGRRHAQGRLFPLSRDELVECAALLDACAAASSTG